MHKIYLFLFAICALLGCNTNFDEIVHNDTKFRLSCVINVSNSKLVKAEYFNSDGDSKLDTLILLVFAEKDGVLVEKIALEKPYGEKITFEKEIDACKVGENYFVRFVGNMNIPEDVKTYSEVSSLKVASESDEKVGVPIPFVMISDSIGFKCSVSDVKLGQIELKRKVARIVVSYSNAVSSVKYLKITGTLKSALLFSNYSSSSENFIINDDSVGLGGMATETTAYYYVYPDIENSFSLIFCIDGIEKVIYSKLEPNKSYSYRFNYNSPVEGYNFNSTLTTYDYSNNEFLIRSPGDDIELTVKENSKIEIPSDATWINLQVESLASSTYKLKVQKNITSEQRQATITVKDKMNILPDKVFTIRQHEAKYMVFVVAGQSNAVGFDESAVYENGLHKTNPRTLQLSYRKGVNQPNLDVIPLKWCVDDIFNYTGTNASGLIGAKGIHQPLAIQMLENFSTTEYADYEILVIPVAYGASAFTTGSLGTYDPSSMSPTELKLYKWGKESVYAKTIVDRVKYVMDLNPKNKLVGFVWCQGESDRFDYVQHNILFQEMAENIFTILNNGNYGSRVAKGIIDKDSWYVYSPPIYYLDYYLSTSVSHVYAGYKSWSPNTFVYIEPKEEFTNMIGGNGLYSPSLTSHFGNNAYITVVAPRVLECMSQNGSLFNGNKRYQTQYTDNTTLAQANTQGGAISDSDISDGLVAFFPFSTSANQDVIGRSNVVVNGGVQIQPTSGLTDIHRQPRTIRALQLDDLGKGLTLSDFGSLSTFSVSLMIKRNANFSNSVQRILTLGTAAVEFKAQKSGTANRRPELMFEPIITATLDYSVVAQFIDALTLRSEQDWFHLLITHDASTKTSSIYINGQLVNKRTLLSIDIAAFNQVILGENALVGNGLRGEVANFMLWNRVISFATMRKLFLYNYYGFDKQVGDK